MKPKQKNGNGQYTSCLHVPSLMSS